MTQMQHIYGYRMIAPDGTVSRWFFIDFKAGTNFSFEIKLKNGAVLQYDAIENGTFSDWARTRELKIETCEFEFDPGTMTFTQTPKKT